ncbi:hypothetical protein [Oryzifoliimicrobium ureilyticus]|uniref:hypothetical protein n=1 Tax=Oryzifoliimicrobium ureilyticus TaxID=3113724 RepID=UPI00307605C9
MSEPSQFFSLLVTALAALAVLWFVAFILRKLVSIALGLALVFGVWALWNDPSLLRSLQDRAIGYYNQWTTDDPRG